MNQKLIDAYATIAYEVIYNTPENKFMGLMVELRASTSDFDYKYYDNKAWIDRTNAAADAIRNNARLEKAINELNNLEMSLSIHNSITKEIEDYNKMGSK